MNLTERIKLTAKNKGLTFASLERLAGFGQGSIRNWDKSSPSCEKLLLVSNLLEVSIEWLLTGKSEINKNSDKDTKDIYEIEIKEKWSKLTDLQRGKITERIDMMIDENENIKNQKIAN